MKRDRIAKDAERELSSSGFATVLASNMHTFVDLFAEGPGGKFIIKAVRNIDSITKKEAVALSRLSQFMGAEPLVVGEASKKSKLERGVSYYRFSIRCISPEMLAEVASGDRTLVASKSVGIKVKIEGSRLHALRKMSGMSVTELARRVSVSSSTLYKHEKETDYASIATVSRLERVLGTVRADESAGNNSKEQPKAGLLENTGLRALRLMHPPFDIVAKDRNYFEISLDANFRTLVKRAELFNAIRDTFQNNYPFFISSKKKGKVMGVPIVGKNDMKTVESEEELLNLVY
ncbi:MAG: helix-turn-helix domain-containing protein [Candidatus Marsarchaeota archaeon]|nr:helix-turn-helix domain-containing protein [Candidatus Marsarchaeota archaeon]